MAVPSDVTILLGSGGEVGGTGGDGGGQGDRIRSVNGEPDPAEGGVGAFGLASTTDGDEAEDGGERSLMIVLPRAELLMLEPVLMSRYTRPGPFKPSVTSNLSDELRSCLGLGLGLGLGIASTIRMGPTFLCSTRWHRCVVVAR